MTLEGSVVVSSIIVLVRNYPKPITHSDPPTFLAVSQKQKIIINIL